MAKEDFSDFAPVSKESFDDFATVTSAKPKRSAFDYVRDAGAGLLKIGGTAVKSGADLAQLATGGAAGGLPSEFKYAKGGITSVPRYDMGGEVESQLENMDEKGLESQARESSSPTIRKMALRILRERQMSKQPESAGAAGVQYQAAQPQMPTMGMRAGGAVPRGIVAFAAGDTVYGGPSSEEGGEEKAKGIDLAGRTMEQRLAMAAPSTPPAGGIMGASPVTQVPAAPVGPLPDVVQEATRQRDIYTKQGERKVSDVMKELQINTASFGGSFESNKEKGLLTPGKYYLNNDNILIRVDKDSKGQLSVIPYAQIK